MKNVSDDLQHASPQAGPEFGRLAGLLVVAATFLAYVDTLALGFVFDDHVLVVTNDSIRSWRYFPTYFTSHIWAFRYPHLLANYYRPLFLAWLRLNDAMFGPDAWGWHLMSTLAHISATYIVYRLAARLTRKRGIAAVAGLIFGLHPVHTEAVAYVSAVQEPLSAFFIVAAILAFARSRELGAGIENPRGTGGHEVVRRCWLGLALISAASALLLKETGIVVPILIAGYAWIYGGHGSGDAGLTEHEGTFRGRTKGAIVASIPFWLVVLAYLPARIHALKGFAHVISPLSLRTELFTIPSVLVFYLRLLVWPFGLSCYYDTPYVSLFTWHDFVMPALVLVAVAAAVGFWYVKTRQSDPVSARVMEFALIWIVLTLVPVLNFRLLPEGEIAHDRYLYLPSVGFVILAALALGQAWDTVAKRLQPALGAAIGIVFLLVMGCATARQNLFWADDLTLNSRAHAIAPNNVYAASSLAAAVAGRGMEGEAMVLYRQVLERQPNFWRANVNLAYLDYAHGNYAEAAHYFARSCAVDPTDGDQFLYLGMSLLRLGRPAEAESAVRTALLVRPQGRQYHLGLGLVLKAEGNLPQAKLEVGRELELDPENPQARSLAQELARDVQPPTPPSNESRVEGERQILK